MKKLISFVLLIFTLVAQAQMLPQYSYRPDEVILKIKDPKKLSKEAKQQLLEILGIRKRDVQSLRKMCGHKIFQKEKIKKKDIKKLSKCLAMLDKYNIDSEQVVNLQQCTEILSNMGCKDDLDFFDGVLKVKLPEGESVDSFLETLNWVDEIESVQPNYTYRVTTLPNDPGLYAPYEYLWAALNTGQTLNTTMYEINNPGLAGKDMNVSDAWDEVTDCSSQIIAVIDSGIRYTHEDIVANLWDGTNCVDADGNPLGGCLYGYDFVNLDLDPWDDNDPVYHGTHVAGTIGAVGNNGIGITGICWNAQILTVKSMSAAGTGNTSDIIAGIYYAVENGATVINMSLGGTGAEDPAYKTALQVAISNGISVIVSAGNETSDNDTTPKWPCNFSDFVDGDLVCVGALDQSYEIADFSNWGETSVDVGAPGVNIISTWGMADDNYLFLNGTSMASPNVAGVAALFQSKNPQCGGSVTQYAIKQSGVSIGTVLPSTTNTAVDALETIHFMSGPDDIYW